MTITTAQVQKILAHTGKHGFSQLGFNMLISRLTRQYTNDSSETAVSGYADEMNSFVTKFAAVMKRDIEVINKL
jgi:hypothetical protein